MLRYVWRLLVQDKSRLLLSVGGVALALVLIIALDAVFLGAENRSTVYIDRSGADVIVSQAGVRTMHMGSSRLPASVAVQVAAVPGVESATPVLFASDLVRVGSSRRSTYVIGLPPDAQTGMPWNVQSGKGMPDPGGAVVDRTIATDASLDLGDTVTILGREFRIDGLSSGTSSLTSSVAIIRLADFASVIGEANAISFVFVRTLPDASPVEVAAAIGSSIPGVTVQTRSQFAAEERELIRDMGVNVIAVMNVFGFLVGLVVMALTVYLSVLARRREFGMLKAIGTGNRRLYGIVLLQALASIVLGVIVAIGITIGLGWLLSALGSNVTLALGRDALVKAILAAVVIAGVSALVPAGRIGRLDPATAFKGG